MRSDLIEMEKKFWTNDPEFYEANYTTDAVLVFQASARWTAGALTNLAQPSGSSPAPHIRVEPMEKRTAREVGPVAGKHVPEMDAPSGFCPKGLSPT